MSRPMFEKIPVRALSDTVAQQLLKQIEKGTFARTGKLPTEAVLAQEFGVSRTVIREAVSRLKNEGVVEPRQGSGVFIVERAGIRPLRIDYAEAVEPSAVVQILALRRAIEAEVASEAAMRRTAADMAAIDAALAKIDAAVAEGDDGVAEDVAFHRAIAVATGNPYFLKTLTFWLCVIFLSFGLIAPRNALALVTISLGAVSIASAIYVIVDLDTPLTGPIMISSAPMRDALAHLGR